MRHSERSLGSHLGNKSKYSEPALIPIERLLSLLITLDLRNSSVQATYSGNKQSTINTENLVMKGKPFREHSKM
jgi:hypothetical protein